MRLFEMIAAGAIGLTVAMAGRAVAQEQQAAAQDQQYETPLYTTGSVSTLDKNYGLPTFGMPGAELPQQRTMAPVADPPVKADLFSGVSDFTLPGKRNLAPADTGMETSQYTTSNETTDTYTAFGTAPAVATPMETETEPRR
jgi:hypothetical protein